MELEMRLIDYDEKGRPITFLALGARKFTVEELKDVAKAQIRFHMVADELLNGALYRLEEEDKGTEELTCLGERMTVKQLKEFAEKIDGEHQIPMTVKKIQWKDRTVIFFDIDM